MKVYAVLGDPVEHSLSPVMQNAAFSAMGLRAYYTAFRVRPPALARAIWGAEAMGFGGLNLTIPHKEQALKTVEPDLEARVIGAVNVVAFNDGLQGFNTDGRGGLMALEASGVKVEGRRVLLLGAGGAARALAFALAGAGADLDIANRTYKRAQDLAASAGGRGYGLDSLNVLVPRAEVIINATSIGLRDDDASPLGSLIPYASQTVMDIVYHRDTQFLGDARKAGAHVLDGVKMLVYQGALAIKIWTGRDAPAEVMERAVRVALGQRRALVEGALRELSPK